MIFASVLSGEYLAMHQPPKYLAFSLARALMIMLVLMLILHHKHDSVKLMALVGFCCFLCCGCLVAVGYRAIDVVLVLTPSFGRGNDKPLHWASQTTDKNESTNRKTKKHLRITCILHFKCTSATIRRC
jgi:hypothetical protein